MAKKEERKEDRFPDADQIHELFVEMEATGIDMPPPLADKFRAWLKDEAEKDLFFFCRWIMGFRDFGKIHRDTCAWLTDFTRTRRKLLMLPVGHLKTSIVSQALPIHIAIQPPATDKYFDASYTGGRGQNVRIVLGNENQKKASENLSVIRETFESNPWIVWLWPELVWDNFNESPRWNESDLVLPRTRIWKEPSFTAFGIENAITGGHYDGILPDDIATIAASQSPPVMERAKTWLKRSMTRLHEPFESLHIGVGTHQNADDVYLEWQKRTDTDLMIRAIEEKDENGVLKPIWPERYNPEKLAKLREDTDAITWSLWYMNRPVASGYTALDWETVREFRWGKSDTLEFDEEETDELFARQHEMMKSPLGRIAHGMALQPVKGNREQMIARHFGRSMSEEHRTHLKDKYAESPASTTAKQSLEDALANRPAKTL